MLQMNKEQLLTKQAKLMEQFSAIKAEGLKLVMTRGVPCPEQLDLSNEMLKITDYKAADGTDCRNYGVVDGISECKDLFAELLNVSPKQIFVGGNSSLNLMHDIIVKSLLVGVPGSKSSWNSQGKVKFICPAPGYDRHFSICELFGIEMIPVGMTENGPNMDEVEKLVASDSSIKGIWIVPKYSNPEGYTCSDEIVKRLANMKAADDFRIFWDNAYAFHHLTDEDEIKLLNIIDECAKSGNPDRAFMFASTSKITFAGAGVSVVASSEANISVFAKQFNIATIGYDKLNQLRHVKFFKNAQGLKEHMKKHAQILKPKFDAVVNTFECELGSLKIAKWTNPKGGYFINLVTLPGCADRVVKLAAEIGVALTAPAASAFPYKKDPNDCNIRISPSFPSVADLTKGIQAVSTCVKIATVEKLILENK